MFKVVSGNGGPLYNPQLNLVSLEDDSKRTAYAMSLQQLKPLDKAGTEVALEPKADDEALEPKVDEEVDGITGGVSQLVLN